MGRAPCVPYCPDLRKTRHRPQSPTWRRAPPGLASGSSSNGAFEYGNGSLTKLSAISNANRGQSRDFTVLAFHSGDGHSFYEVTLKTEENDDRRHRHQHVRGHEHRPIGAMIDAHAEEAQAEWEFGLVTQVDERAHKLVPGAEKAHDRDGGEARLELWNDDV